MKTRKINPEVVYSDEDVLLVRKEDLDALKRESLATPRKRIRLCAHRDVSDRLHEMLIVHARGAYVRPHRHPGKTESLHVIEGTADAVFFDDRGGVSEIVRLGDRASGLPFYYRIAAPVYHCLVITSDVFVFHEATNGPFDRKDTDFAPWAPDDSDEKACAAYVAELERGIREDRR